MDCVYIHYVLSFMELQFKVTIQYNTRLQFTCLFQKIVLIIICIWLHLGRCFTITICFRHLGGLLGRSWTNLFWAYTTFFAFIYSWPYSFQNCTLIEKYVGFVSDRQILQGSTSNLYLSIRQSVVYLIFVIYILTLCKVGNTPLRFNNFCKKDLNT
jgi:hypothetical protein